MFLDRERVVNALRQGFPGVRVVVAGDLILDRYLWGEVCRISPEAPVPVVRVRRETERGGGAANVALNLTGLGVTTQLAGYVGEDGEGQRLQHTLRANAIDPVGVVARQGWPTITKTRVIGGHQQMLRLDWEEPTAATPAEGHALGQRLATALAQHPSAVVLSDYAKGVLTPELCQLVIHTCRQQAIPVLVDPKGADYEKYRHATVISPNRQELAVATGQGGTDLEALLTAAVALRQHLAIDFLAVTLSDLGIALIDADGVRRLPAMAREVFDVSGAGDTVIATLAAALAAGCHRLDALHLANLAAGVVVGKVGTTPITRPELLAALSGQHALEQSDKIAPLEEMVHRVAHWRQRGETVVFTNGCFDLLHAGHVTYLEKARQLGQRLVVGLNTDQSVKKLKGPRRPIIGEADRARVLAAMAAVDAVILFDEETPLALIRALHPDILAKGADYTEEQVVGGRLVQSWGGRVALVSLVEGRSSSGIVATIQERGDPAVTS